ncbi:MAG TPA: DUF4214 domain-containing protein, partial [Gemmataceae bacterium]|nr:DUF4214 domain-containing protein [Gemmataceae bacterium]
TLTANTAQGGGGGFASSNGGSGYGGAIFNLDGSVTLNNDTLAANTVRAGAGGSNGVDGQADGGAVFNLAYGNKIVSGGAVIATLTLNNNILSNTTGGTDLFSNAINGNNTNTAAITGSTNLIQSNKLTNTSVATGGTIRSDPKLGPLQDNGGPAPTMALTSNSPAYGAGDASVPGLPTTDQRGPGFARTVNGRLDLGAFEIQNAVTINTVAAPDTADRATAFTGLSAQERFVQALYLDELGRAGSQGELHGWVNGVLNAPGGSPQAVATRIAASPEADDHLVKSWYLSLLGRPANGTEEQGWVQMLQSGTSEEQVLSGILASPEFYARAQTMGFADTPDGNYVRALYQLLLDRSASGSELAGWVGNLHSGLSQQAVALGFLTSTEFRTNQFEGYYETLLHRPADPTGLSGWANSSVDLDSVRIGIESSSEFFSNG